MTAQFSAEVDQNEYLPEGGRLVDAIIAVTAQGGDLRQPGAAPSAAEVIMVDVSGSMGTPAQKIAEAKKATAVAIDTLRDGVAFAVVAGTTQARMVYPRDTRMVPTGGPPSAGGWTWRTTCSPGSRPRSNTRSCSPTGATSTKPRRTSSGC